MTEPIIIRPSAWSLDAETATAETTRAYPVADYIRTFAPIATTYTLTLIFQDVTNGAHWRQLAGKHIRLIVTEDADA
jgi:hypothetical protein